MNEQTHRDRARASETKRAPSSVSNCGNVANTVMCNSVFMDSLKYIISRIKLQIQVCALCTNSQSFTYFCFMFLLRVHHSLVRLFVRSHSSLRCFFPDGNGLRPFKIRDVVGYSHRSTFPIAFRKFASAIRGAQNVRHMH